MVGGSHTKHHALQQSDRSSAQASSLDNKLNSQGNNNTGGNNNNNNNNGGNENTQHPKHQEAQIFVSAFAGILTPVWFACNLKGCRDEASASAILRLMILMVQNSNNFAKSFEERGGFAPLVPSIPKFSTCPSIILSMLPFFRYAVRGF